MVDGAFDPLHAGHLAYLQAAKDMGLGPLLCAVASDADILAKGRAPFLPQESRVAIMEALSLVDYVILKDRPTEAILEALQPHAYVKGADWQDGLPQAQMDVCQRLGIPIRFTETLVDSSSHRLQTWALAEADRSLDRLTTTIAAQTVTPPDRYDAEYFTNEWRGEGQAYTIENRRKIEDKHPLILSQVFPGRSMLDVGCGPGFLVQFLRELGIEAGGVDPSPSAKALAVNRWVIKGYPFDCPNNMADVVICREVLEHLTVTQVFDTVAELFRLAKHAVYITTRFHDGSLFDVEEERHVDPTHQTLLTQPFLRSLCVLNGGIRRRDWETTLDHQQKGRVLCYEVSK